jgi:6-phospho-3-hexuloisomerase
MARPQTKNMQRTSRSPRAVFARVRPKLIKEIHAALAGVDPAQVHALADAMLDARRIFIAGRGRTGFVMQAFAVRLMHLGLKVHVVGETTTPNIARADLLVAGSGSGETRFTNVAASIAREFGAKIACITSRPESSLGKTSDIVVAIPAPAFKAETRLKVSSIQPVGSLFEQTLLLLVDSVVLILMDRLGITCETLLRRHANVE